MDDSGEWLHLYAEVEGEEAALVDLGAVVAATRAALGSPASVGHDALWVSAKAETFGPSRRGVAGHAGGTRGT